MKNREEERRGAAMIIAMFILGAMVFFTFAVQKYQNPLQDDSKLGLHP